MKLRSEISGALGFMRGLPGFLRQPMSPDEAREILALKGSDDLGF